MSVHRFDMFIQQISKIRTFYQCFFLFSEKNVQVPMFGRHKCGGGCSIIVTWFHPKRVLEIWNVKRNMKSSYLQFSTRETIIYAILKPQYQLFLLWILMRWWWWRWRQQQQPKCVVKICQPHTSIFILFIKTNGKMEKNYFPEKKCVQNKYAIMAKIKRMKSSSSHNNNKINSI